MSWEYYNKMPKTATDKIKKIIDKRQVGFSLLEMLIVMVIMAILLLAASPNYRANMQNWQHQQAELTLHDAQLRLASWLLQHGSYSEASLAALAISPPAGYQLNLRTTDNSYELVATNSSGKDTIIKRA